jgi:hypothetical protein
MTDIKLELVDHIAEWGGRSVSRRNLLRLFWKKVFENWPAIKTNVSIITGLWVLAPKIISDKVAENMRKRGN